MLFGNIEPVYNTTSVPKLLSPIDFFGLYFSILAYFCLYYIILDAKYMNGLSFKCIFIDIIFIKYCITQIKILIVKVDNERPKKLKWDNNFETDGI